MVAGPQPADVLRRFMLNQSVTLSDLDRGVQECIMAKTVCRGLEINQKLVKKHRNGSFWLDFLGFKRETHTEGWRFNALVLLKDDVVVYKLTGGQPAAQFLNGVLGSAAGAQAHPHPAVDQRGRDIRRPGHARQGRHHPQCRSATGVQRDPNQASHVAKRRPCSLAVTGA